MELIEIESSDSKEVIEVKKTLNKVGNKAIEEAVKKAKEEAGQHVKSAVDSAVEKALKDANEAAEKQLEEKLKVVKDEVEKNKTEANEALAALNRFRDAGKANEAKGVSFQDALLNQMETAEVVKGLNDLKNSVKGAYIRMELKSVSTMGLSSISGLDVARAELLPGILPIPKRRIHVRDIMSTGRMTASDLHFLKMTSTDSSAMSVAENGQINQIDFNFVETSAPSQYISAFLKISRKSLDDITALRASIADRLLQEYLLAEDSQILTGNGSGSNLSGLLVGSNSFTYAGSKTVAVEKLIDAAAAVENNNLQVTGILMNPTDYVTILLTQSSGSTAGIYSLPGLGVVSLQNGILHINDIPVYKSTAIQAGEALLGDWQNGAQLFLREDPIVEFFDQDGTNAQFNQITVRVQGRVALPIYYGGSNGAFCRVSFGQYQS